MNSLGTTLATLLIVAAMHAAAAELGGAGLAHAGPLALADFTDAARSGDARAAYRAGLMVRNGKGTPRDSVAARRWLDQAARGGVPEAMFVLANMLIEGEGGAVDAAAARTWLERAAALGHPGAMQQLAQLLHEAGDSEGANTWLKNSAHALQHGAVEPP